jgi:hypothetical protein
MEIADAAISIGTMLTVISALPSIFSAHKPSKWTSLLIFVATVIFASTYWSLGYVGSGSINTLAAILWLVLLIQEIRIERKENVN